MNTVANIAKYTGLAIGAITVGAVYASLKTVKTCVKLPIVASVNICKSIKHARDCCSSMLDAVKNNHIECFDKYFVEFKFDKVIESFNFMQEVINSADPAVDAPPELHEHVYDYVLFLAVTEARLNEHKQHYVLENQEKYTEATNSPLNFIPSEKTIDLYLKSTKERYLEEYIHKKAYKRFIKLLHGEQSIGLIQSNLDKYYFDTCTAFCRGCLSLFSSIETCKHVLQFRDSDGASAVTKMPKIMFRPVLVQQAYHYYYLLHSHEICELLIKLFPNGHELNYNPLIAEKTFLPSSTTNFARKCINVSKYFNIVDTHFMLEEFSNKKQKLVSRLHDTEQNELSKELLDQCVNEYYTRKNPVTTNHFFIFCLENDSSKYLKSYLKYYGILQYATGRDEVPQRDALHPDQYRSVFDQSDEDTPDQSREIMNSFRMDSNNFKYALYLIHKAILNSDTRTSTQHFIMQEFLKHIGRYKYLYQPQTSCNALNIFFKLFDDKDELRFKMSHKVISPIETSSQTKSNLSMDYKTRSKYDEKRNRVTHVLINTCMVKDIAEIVCDYSL